MRNTKISIGVMSMFLIISIGNYMRISDGSVRTVEFISILAIGALTGLIISQVIQLIKKG
jgi:hypothetical protein